MLTQSPKRPYEEALATLLNHWQIPLLASSDVTLDQLIQSDPSRQFVVGPVDSALIETTARERAARQQLFEEDIRQTQAIRQQPHARLEWIPPLTGSQGEWKLDLPQGLPRAVLEEIDTFFKELSYDPHQQCRLLHEPVTNVHSMLMPDRPELLGRLQQLAVAAGQAFDIEKLRIENILPHRHHPAHAGTCIEIVPSNVEDIPALQGWLFDNFMLGEAHPERPGVLLLAPWHLEHLISVAKTQLNYGQRGIELDEVPPAEAPQHPTGLLLPGDYSYSDELKRLTQRSDRRPGP